MGDVVEFTVRVRMQRRFVPQFLGMLKTMQALGAAGASRIVAFYADGDGDFRPSFDWDGAAGAVAAGRGDYALAERRGGFFFDPELSPEC